MSQSLERALDLVDLVAAGHESLDDLSSQLGVHKTTVLRLLRVLEARDYVRHDRNHRYRIGHALYSFTLRRPDADEVRTVAAPLMRTLGREVGQTVHLAAYDEGRVTYIDKVDSGQKLRMYSQVGLPAALHATAVGKVLLGGLPEQEREGLIADHEYTVFTENTLRTPAALRAAIAEASARGWASDHEEHETFMNCVGAPVRDADGSIVAAVSVSVPNVVLGYRDVLALLPALRDTVIAISADLGYRGPYPFHLPDVTEREPHV